MTGIVGCPVSAARTVAGGPQAGASSSTDAAKGLAGERAMIRLWRAAAEAGHPARAAEPAGDHAAGRAVSKPGGLIDVSADKDGLIIGGQKVSRAAA